MPNSTAERLRRPSVAGYFYPADPQALCREIDRLAPRAAGAGESAVALVAPHGSFRHAGAVAGAAFARLNIPARCVILGPSHAGSRMPWSLMDRGSYQTPLGEIPVDARCADALRARCPFLEPDASAQRGEHAIEVVLPWLQRLGPAGLTAVPIIIGAGCTGEEVRRMAQALAQVVRLQEEPVLLIASADLSQFQDRARGAALDRALLNALCALNLEELARCVLEDEPCMCGYEAVQCVTQASIQLGASRAALAGYGTSLDGGGDPQSVTGYAGIVIR